MITPSSASPSVAHVARAPEPNDPLAGMSQMHIWREALWQDLEGVETTQELAVLLRLAANVDHAGRGCSISYAQLARETRMDIRTAKRVVDKLQDRWLYKVKCGGRHIPHVGNENLYYVLTPPRAVDHLREMKLEAHRKALTEVASRHRARKAKNSTKSEVAERGGSKSHVYASDNQYSNSRESTPGSASAEWRNGIDPNYGRDLPDEEAA